MKKLKKEVRNNKKPKRKINIIKISIFSIVLLITIYLAYAGIFEKIVNKLGIYGIIGIFITGCFYGYSFASVPAVAMFIFLAKQYNPFFIASIGALGVLTENFFMFLLFKKGLNHDIELVAQKFGIYLKKLEKKPKWILILISLIVLTTPIPNEIAIYILSVGGLREEYFIVFAFLSSFCSILFISLIGTLI